MSIDHRKAAQFLGVDPDADRRARRDGQGRVVLQESEAAAQLGLTEADIVRLAREGGLVTADFVGPSGEFWIVESSLDEFRRAS